MGRAQAGLYELDRDVQVGGATAGRKVGSRRARGAGVPSKSLSRLGRSSQVKLIALKNESDRCSRKTPRQSDPRRVLMSESEDRRPLSVLVMHFARDSNGNCKQLYSLCEERFVHTRGLQKAISLSEAGPHVYWKQSG